jgi:muconolactone delta-isomerase
MNTFLVHISIDTGGLAHDAVKVLREQESERAAQLAASGNLLRLWRVPGRWENWGLWAAPDDVQLNLILKSLPLYKFMRITVHSLSSHPSDPGEATR